jgi:hypothetical protein
VLQGKGPADLGFDLQQGVAQGSVAATLRSGTRRICAACTAAGSQDGANGTKFSGNVCPAPAACGP